MPSRALRFSLLVLASTAMLLAGCVTVQNSRPGSRYEVVGSTSQFYKYGPAQAFGPDATLPKGEKVTLVKSEIGFSQVRRENNETGYIATESLRLLPPDPVRPTPKPSLVKRRSSRTPRSKPEPEPQLDLSDVPVPDLPAP